MLSIQVNWAYKRFDHLFGTLTYDGQSVYGFRSTAGGEPLDSFGRNIYLDTFDSAYGAGLEAREQLSDAQVERRVLLRLLSPRVEPGGERARAIARRSRGPGVTPDVMWQGVAPGPFDAAAEADANDSIRALGDNQCKPV